MTQSEPILKQILHSIRSHSKGLDQSSKLACVFDIDSTLFCVSTRTQAILRSLAKEKDFRSQFKEHAELLKEIKVQPMDWGTKQALLRLDIEFPLPVINHIRNYWRKHFFSNEFLKHDVLYDSSNLFVQICEQLNCEIYYLTGRNEKLMRKGSLEQLHSFSFPLSHPDRLIMKAIDDEHDEDFKLNKLRELSPKYEQIYFFENEPVIIHSVLEHLPQVNIVFMDSTHSTRREPPRNLPTITPDSYKLAKDFK